MGLQGKQKAGSLLNEIENGWKVKELSQDSTGRVKCFSHTVLGGPRMLAAANGCLVSKTQMTWRATKIPLINIPIYAGAAGKTRYRRNQSPLSGFLVLLIREFKDGF